MSCKTRTTSYCLSDVQNSEPVSDIRYVAVNNNIFRILSKMYQNHVIDMMSLECVPSLGFKISVRFSNSIS